MITHLFRYRPIEAVLDGFHELENQEIYFSTVGELNDPMEGFKDLFWAGDEVVWRNFLKHYLLCLQETAMHVLIMGAEFNKQIIETAVFAAPDNLPDAPIRTIYAKICEDFLSEDAVKTFLAIVSSRTAPIRRNELISSLRALHAFALHAMFKEFANHNLVHPPKFMAGPTPDDLRASAKRMMEGVATLPSENADPEKMSETLFAANEAVMAQLDLIFEYGLTDRTNDGLAFVTRYFPAAYAKALDKIVHRDWYVACFSANATNPSMWGTYGQGHRGVCLKFRTPENDAGQPTFTVNQLTAASASRNGVEYHSGYVTHALHKLSYQPEYPAIDFFRSLGAVREVSMNNFWYRGDDGSFSSCREAIYSDADAWRTGYWNTFTASALCKTPEWSHEEEFRLILHSGFDLREKEQRKLKYKFDDLTGIVFGARTSMEDKLRIIRAVQKKCAAMSRTEFEFSEVLYNSVDRKFVISPLNLIKFSAPSPADGDAVDSA